MRILILGGSGLIGNRLVRTLDEVADVFATTRKDDSDGFPKKLLKRNKWITKFEASDFKLVEKKIRESKPDVLINCVGDTKRGLFPKDLSSQMQINSLLPHFLNSLAIDLGVRLVHLSTDCVFSGGKGNYSETFVPDAIDVYGRFKADGEFCNPFNLTLRTSFVGREINSFTNLFEWARRNQNRKIQGFKNVVYSGFTTLAFSTIVKEIIFEKQNLTGLWNVASKPISKLDLLVMLNDSLKYNLDIESNDEVVLNRSLNSEEFKKSTQICIPSWAKMIEDYALDDIWYTENLR